MAAKYQCSSCSHEFDLTSHLACPKCSAAPFEGDVSETFDAFNVEMKPSDSNSKNNSQQSTREDKGYPIVGWNNLDRAQPESYLTTKPGWIPTYKLYVEDGNWIIRHQSGRDIASGGLEDIIDIELKTFNMSLKNDTGFWHVYLDGHTAAQPKKIRLMGNSYGGAKAFRNFKAALTPAEGTASDISQKRMRYKAACLGGVGIELTLNKYGHLEISSSGFSFASRGEDWNRSFDELVTIEIDGQGYYTKGGGFVGYGNTADAQARGNKQAMILNSFTTRVVSDCRIRIVYPGQEVTFKVEYDPTQLGIDLSGIKNWLTVRAKTEQKTPASEVDQLEKLIAMFEKGHLSKSEFEAAKSKLLNN